MFGAIGAGDPSAAAVERAGTRKLEGAEGATPAPATKSECAKEVWTESTTHEAARNAVGTEAVVVVTMLVLRFAVVVAPAIPAVPVTPPAAGAAVIVEADLA